MIRRMTTVKVANGANTRNVNTPATGVENPNVNGNRNTIVHNTSDNSVNINITKLIEHIFNPKTM